MGKRKVLTLCGSSRFQKEHERAQMELTLRGIIVIPMGMYGHLIPGFDMTGEIKKELDKLHFDKIDISHGIYVVNAPLLVCTKCEKPCESKFHPVGATGYSNSKCCKANAYSCPYIGESTRNEIEYARSLGKEINWLNPPTTA